MLRAHRPVPAAPKCGSHGDPTPPAAVGGFTLVEALITIAFITLLSTVAVPSLLRSRTASNEAAAIMTLRAIAETQLRFREACIVDQDGDGQGEFGTLSELIEHAPALGPRKRLSSLPLRAALGSVDAAGRATGHGYVFALHLPDAAGKGLAGPRAASAGVDPDLAERHWTCIAWPVRQGEGGTHAFFINEKLELRSNRSARYSGTLRVPSPGAALTGTASPRHITAGRLPAGEPAADGQIWLAVE